MIKVEVIFMLHNEERHLIIQALNHHIPVKEIAECFSVSIPWLQSHSIRYREPSIPNDRAT